MQTDIKYVMFHYKNSDLVDFVIFNKKYVHLNVKEEFFLYIGGQDDSPFENDFPTHFTAGFLSLEKDGIKTVGFSESLGVKSDKKDAKIIDSLIKENHIDLIKILEEKKYIISFVQNEYKEFNWRYDFLSFF